MIKQLSEHKLFILLLLAILPLSFSHAATSKADNLSWLSDKAPIKELVVTDVFHLPEAKATGVMSGKLTISQVENSEYFDLLRDSWDILKTDQWQVNQLPAMALELVSHNGYLVSTKVALQKSSHPHWEWQVGAGRFAKLSDQITQVVLPFALSEKNANCTHNGWLTFTLDSKQQASPGYFQIASETCAYLQFNMAGRLQIDFQPGEVKGADTHIERFNNIMARNSKSATEFSTDFPELDINNLLPRNPETSTTSGLVIKGQHYKFNCETRMGPHPDCRQVVLPSYSTAKSLYAGVGLMYLEQRVPGINQALVSKIIPECPADKWGDVTLGDLVNMRTGNYLTRKYHADESASRMIEFLTAPTHAKRLDMACNMFPQKSKPGKHFVYHTSDTYLAGVMMERLFKQLANQDDIYSVLLAGSLWAPLKLSPLMDDSKRTYDEAQQTFTGWGLTYLTDDVIKLSEFLYSQAASETPELNPIMLGSALQLKDNNINREGGLANIGYNHGFWSLEVGGSIGCKNPKWIPFMSGFGGITIALISPDLIYYNYTDNHRHVWLNVVTELNKKYPLCED